MSFPVPVRSYHRCNQYSLQEGRRSLAFYSCPSRSESRPSSPSQSSSPGIRTQSHPTPRQTLTPHSTPYPSCSIRLNCSNPSALAPSPKTSTRRDQQAHLGKGRDIHQPTGTQARSSFTDNRARSKCSTTWPPRSALSTVPSFRQPSLHFLFCLINHSIQTRHLASAAARSRHSTLSTCTSGICKLLAPAYSQTQSSSWLDVCHLYFCPIRSLGSHSIQVLVCSRIGLLPCCFSLQHVRLRDPESASWELD